ncbi:hypothetical protein EUGRSUZ_E02740 [Eucalyptus grandis]|uniref:Uncharacterized protein n=2 Tax=Eucalyptus grandis TaxID=71139 RepID=A0ACC3KYG5_EUCGR|nr:hypothetical protein EUGRSUZ_E02740 [Eucalyptus grandis]
MAFTFKSESIISLALIFGAWARQAMSVRILCEPTIAEQHQQWMTEYVRTYEDPQEKAKYQAIFAENLQFIEDFKSHTEYLASKQPEPAETTSYSHKNLADDFPDNIDKVEKGVVNHIKYQGRFDCDATSYICRGGYPDTAFKYIIRSQGIASQNTYAYHGMDRTCNATKAAEHMTRIKGFADVPPGEDELMKAVAQQPIAVVIGASGREFQSYKHGVFNGDCGS